MNDDRSNDRYVVGSTSTLYMCGHGEYQLRRGARPGATHFLGWPEQAATLVDWLNAQPPHVTTRLVNVGLDPRPCGHYEFWLTGDTHEAVVFYESSHASATRLLDWLGRHPRTEEDRE